VPRGILSRLRPRQKNVSREKKFSPTRIIAASSWLKPPMENGHRIRIWKDADSAWQTVVTEQRHLAMIVKLIHQ